MHINGSAILFVTTGMCWLLNSVSILYIGKKLRSNVHTDQLENHCFGTSLVTQWLRLHTPNAECLGSIPGQETKIPYATSKTW